MAGEIHSKREKLLVVMRADAAGMTSNAEMSRGADHAHGDQNGERQ